MAGRFINYFYSITLTLVLTGCGSSGSSASVSGATSSGSPTGQFGNQVAAKEDNEDEDNKQLAFITDDLGGGNWTLSTYRLKANGKLKSSNSSLITSGQLINGNSNCQVIEPSGHFLYTLAGSNPGGFVLACSIDKKGKLTPIGQTTLNGQPNGAAPSSIKADPLGRFIYIGVGLSLFSFSIGPDGNLTQVGSPLSSIDPKLVIAAERDGKFIYTIGGRDIEAYSVGANGALTTLPSFHSNGGPPQFIEADPVGPFIFAAVGLQQSSVLRTLAVGTTGGLTQVGQDVTTPIDSQYLAVDRGGHFLYGSQGGRGIYSYSIASTGTLAPVGPVLGPTVPAFYPTVDPTGQFLFTFSRLGNTTETSIATDGSLGQVVQQPTGERPQSVVFAP